ncbi:DUF1768 domain-containing protein [Vibrio diazotrophicus]|uniref:DUF1768 domain-containing protein n=2 Tax=Vibrio diazotrophicus TaxID=685 RepID=A0A2J8HYK1_VIBDI|nr:DUF1768 domain-containing protein [Vibrio diazotrophicus]
MHQENTRQYDIRTVAAFKKTNEKWGGLSNMAGGFPVVVNGLPMQSVEALYQACRFPHLPEVQKKILAQSSPMTAKMVGKPHKRQSRPDWEQVQILIMKWCLRVKLAQNWETFSNLLLDTRGMQIVELSNKDGFWGAKPVEDNIYAGVNALGRLLMELREQIILYKKEHFLTVAPLNIPHFTLYGQDIKEVSYQDSLIIEIKQLNMFPE